MKKKSAAGHQKNNGVVEGLSLLLADTYLLYLKTQNFHWNVTGPLFYSLHQLFEDQYQGLAEAVDVIAERIRALNARAPASFSQFLKITSLEESDGILEANDMIQELLHDHQQIARSLTKLFAVAEASGDEVTLDLFIQRKTEHDKIAWMLLSSLK